MFLQNSSSRSSASALSISPALSWRDRLEFVRLPSRIYADDPHMRSLPGIVHLEELHQRLNPWFQHGKAQLFLARRDGKVVGRISAQIDYEHLRYHDDDTGFFGFFECEEDPLVAQKLLSVAEDWCRAEGMSKIRGPFSFSINNVCGLLVDGFDSPNYVMMPHGKSYYGDFLCQSQYQKAMDLYAWRYVRKDLSDPVQQIADAVAEHPGLVVRTIDMANLERDIKIIIDIFNEAWSNNWGFVPLTEAEVMKLVREFRLAADPSLCLIAEVDGEPAAMAVAFPNLHEAFGSCSTSLLPLSSLRAIYKLKRGKCKSFRQILLGVRKKFRGSTLGGLSVLLYVTLFREAYARGYQEAEASWTLANNERINNGMEFMGAERYKTYRIYEKELFSNQS